MLQTNMLETDSAPSAGLGQNAQGGGIGSLVNFALAFLKRQYLIIIVSAILATAASVVYLKITPPTYTAQAQVLLGNTPQFVQQQSLTAPQLDLNQIDTQLQIIKSRAIAVAVINQLKLEDDPDFKASGVFSSLWRWIRNGGPPDDSQVEAGGPSEDAIKAFEERLSAYRVDYSNVIEISFNSSSARRAAEIANATAKAYIDDQINAKSDANRLATKWLQERLRDLGEQAVQAERAVSAYKSKNNIVSSGGKPIDELKVTELNSRLTAARAQTSDALAKLNRYETILSANSTDSSSIGTLDAAGAEALNNQIINKLRQEYLELSARASEWAGRYGRDHSAVTDLKARMRDVRASILDEVKRLAESSRGELQVARQRQEEVEKQLAEAITQSRSTDSAEMTIRSLENQAKALRKTYDTFLQRYMGSVQQETFPNTETRVLSPAAPPQRKSKPQTLKILLLGIVGGLGFGAALGLLKELMDGGFRTSAQIERALELPCLSLVPQLPALERATPSDQAEEDLRRRLLSTKSAIHHAIIGMPFSRFAESIRSIKLAIDLNPNKASSQVIGITSALPSEGKTTIATTLAQHTAHGGKKVIIVDCDVRRPSLSANLAPNAEAGIIEIINGSRSIEDTIWRDPITNLAFLPFVRREPLTHITEFFSAEAMRKLFEQLRANYDCIIVDLPPLAPVIDVRASLPLVDSFILVVEWGRTKIDVVQRALHTAPNVYQGMIGAVLNKTDMKAMISYDTYGGEYYSDKYDARYGFSQTEERV